MIMIERDACIKLKDGAEIHISFSIDGSAYIILRKATKIWCKIERIRPSGRVEKGPVKRRASDYIGRKDFQDALAEARKIASIGMTLTV